MGHRLEPFAEIGLDEAMLAHLIERHRDRTVPGLDRLWNYYRNPEIGRRGDGRSMLAQERGLPGRLRGLGWEASTDGRDLPEAVIENDIAWRIDALVEFLFGKPIRLRSTADDADRRAEIERAIDSVLESSGGMGLLQNSALMAAVYGWVDFIVRSDASGIRIEPIAPTRGIPIVDPTDYRRLLGYIIRTEQTGRIEAESRRTIRAVLGGMRRRARRHEVIEILSATHRQVYADGVLVAEEPNALGVLPVVHVQNTGQPLRYAGQSDVEPLIPLQDELNTRLSDRARRITMQSFNMYLAKGLELDSPLPIGPGQLWMTQNPDARIEAFGGDGHSPSEDRHIEEIREAMDKTSSVSPAVLGVIRTKLGHLSSANALRIAMLGVLSRTDRKRALFGRGIQGVCGLVLHAMDLAGVLRTDEGERGVRIEWRDPLPRTQEELLREARLKVDLGVSQERVLEELGY
ncbi:MAG: phage portal protein [Phycisphaeraceae bacterium]|nr:MAG: phage portal protein [Phycisphaeraceae bacterium]